MRGKDEGPAELEARRLVEIRLLSEKMHVIEAERLRLVLQCASIGPSPMMTISAAVLEQRAADIAAPYNSADPDKQKEGRGKRSRQD